MTAGQKLVFASAYRKIYLGKRKLVATEIAAMTCTSPRYVRDTLRLLYTTGRLKRRINGRVAAETISSGHFTRIPLVLMASPKLTPLEKLIWSHLVSLAGRKGFWFGTDNALAKECGTYRDGICSALASLVGKNFLHVERNAKHSDHLRKGLRQSTYYFRKTALLGPSDYI